MNTNLYYTALNNGYIYIPGYCFKSKINYNIDNKASIIRYWNFTDLGSVFNVTKNSTNLLNKTIAIQYYGSDGTNSNKYSFFRQFWLEDIKSISSSSIGTDTNYFGKDSGIFVRNLNDINTIISNPENTSNYDWINTGLNPITFDSSNFNMLDKIQFIMVLNDGYFVKSWVNDNLTKLQTFTTNYGNNRPDDNTLNSSLIFQLEKQNTNKNDNNFALKVYNKDNRQWYYITCNYYGGNKICGFTSSPEYRTVTIINTNNENMSLDWNGVRIKQDWSNWNVCAQTSWYHSPKYKIIQPNYDYIFDKLKTNTIIKYLQPQSPVINLTSSYNNSINLNFSKNSDGGSPITSYTVTSYYDGGCSYRNIPTTDTTNLKTNTDGTLKYNYPVSSRKSYTGNLNSLPTNCSKENYDYIDIEHKPIISFSKTPDVSNNEHKVKENYIFTLSAINNVGQGPISFTTEDTIPVISVSPTGPSVPVSPTGPSVPVSPTGPSVPVSPTGPSVPVSPTGPSVPVSPTGPSVPVSPTGPSVPVSPIIPTKIIDTELLVPNPPKFTIKQYQNNIYIFITYPPSALGVTNYNINFSQANNVYNTKVYVDNLNIVKKIEPSGIMVTFSSIQGVNIPSGTIPLIVTSNIQSGKYDINITATNSYGTSLLSKSTFTFQPQLPEQPSPTISKYLIISIVIVLIILIIIAVYFLLKKN